MRLLASAILATAGLALTQVALAGPASACSGTLGFRNLHPNKGEFVVYYSSGSGGTNCARMNHLGSCYGATSWTEVWLLKYKETRPSLSCTVAGPAVKDRGNYAYYAGSVYQYNTNGKCVDGWGVHLGLRYDTPSTIMCG